MMVNEALIKVEGIAKKYCRDFKRSMWYGLLDISDEFLCRDTNDQLREKEFWAVREVSFELRRGECMGLIGRNGSGKSSVLKMLNGLVKPNKGRIEMRGRVGAMIQLGAGFNPLLSGRENIYVNGAILGFTKREIDRKFDEIVAFAEMEDYLDMPVYNYSSGMFVKLGFSVSAHLEPDILLIDEVLSVGDIGFRQKCINKMEGLLESCAIVFVSHSVPQITRICNKLLVLDKGVGIDYAYGVREGLERYAHAFTFEKKVYQTGTKARLIRVGLRDTEDAIPQVAKYSYGSDVNIWIEFEIWETLQSPMIQLNFMDRENRKIAAAQYAFDEQFAKTLGKKQVQALVPVDAFRPGTYAVNIVLSEQGNKPVQILFKGNAMIEFSIVGEEGEGLDLVQNKTQWSCS